MKKMIWNRTQGIAGVLVFAGILIALNVLLGGWTGRVDLTQEKLYTLSSGTVKLLAGLQRPVELKFYATRGEGVPVPVLQYEKRIEDLLREYARHSDGKIKIKVEDPQPDSDAEEWAQRYGLRSTPLSMMGGGPDLYIGMAALSGANEASLPFLSPDDEPQLEYQITRLVHEVTLAHRPKVGVLSTLPVMGGPPAMPFGPQASAKPWVVMEELKKLYKVEAVEPNGERIPDDITALVVIQPSGLEDKTLYAIDQFVLRGGRLVVFEDPVCVAQLESQRQNPYAAMMGQNASSDLNRLTEAWGLTMDPSKMVADPEAATPVRTADGRARRNDAWLSLRSGNINRDDVAISGLEDLMLPFAGAIEGKPAKGLTLTRLVTASPDAGLTGAMQATMPGAAPEADAPAAEPLPLAVRLTGIFPTAFPDGPPAEPKKEAKPGEEAKAPTPADTAQDEGLKVGSAPGVVVLVGDVDLLYDRFAVQPLNFLGYSGYQLANDNIAFLLNTVEQLAGSQALIGLRSRGTSDRPFTVVLEIERRAAEKWRLEEQRLQQKLQETRQRLSELQTSKDPTQKLILSEEQRKEIEQFREEQFQTERQLKEVRKNLRKRVESLGLWLKVFNIAAVPLLVAAFGLYHGFVRRRRAGA